jgi:hypothetical protein
MEASCAAVPVRMLASTRGLDRIRVNFDVAELRLLAHPRLSGLLCSLEHSWRDQMHSGTHSGAVALAIAAVTGRKRNSDQQKLRLLPAGS